MEIDDPDSGIRNPEAVAPVYEPLTHSETYLMSTMSDMSEDNYNYLSGLNSDVSRQSSSRETRPLIRGSLTNNEPRANLLQTISGVLHSQSVRITPSGNNAAVRAATLHPIRRNLTNPHHATLARMEMPLNVSTVNGNDFVRLNLGEMNPESATYIASTTSDLGQQQYMTNAYLGKHQQFLRANGVPVNVPVNSGQVMQMQAVPTSSQPYEQ